MALVPAHPLDGLPFDIAQLENIILTLAERYNIRLAVDLVPNPGLTLGLAVAGGLLGFYLGGKYGMMAGAVGGAGGAVVMSLRERWDIVRDHLQELYYIIYNYLRSLDIADYVAVGGVVYNCIKNREHIVRNIVEFIAMKLGTTVLSSLDNH